LLLPFTSLTWGFGITLQTAHENRRHVTSRNEWLATKRTKETWTLRGLALMTFLNIVLLFKLSHPQTIALLDDFQMLWFSLFALCNPSTSLYRCLT